MTDHGHDTEKVGEEGPKRPGKTAERRKGERWREMEAFGTKRQHTARLLDELVTDYAHGGD